MAFVAVSLSVGTAIGLGTGTAAIIGGGALIGAGVGGLYSAVTGDGNILNSMLTGGLIGGAGAFGLNAMGVGAGATTAAAEAATAAGATGAGTVGPAATTVKTVTAAEKAAEAAALLDAAAVTEGGAQAGMATQYAAQEAAKNAAIQKTAALTGKQVLGYGLAGTAGMQLLGGRGKGAQAPASAGDPGMIRPFEYSSTPNEATGIYPSPYATASYEASGNPIMDTRERNYFDQNFAAMQPYSARIGTVNPNVPLPSSSPINAANGGIMRNYDDEMGRDDTSSDQGNLQKGLFGLGYANGGVARFADKGMVDEEAELRKVVMNNLKKLNPEQMQNVMSNFQEEGEREKQFLMKNMPNYAEAMRPSISGMIEGAQYGDRMAKSYGGQPRDINVTPTIVDPESGMYGGIASIGRQIDPNTRVNAMANIQRTPYDRNTMESVRRLGVGVDRQIGKDSNLSAFYEQDPMGRNKAGGLRYTKQFNMGGAANLGDYSDGGRLLRGPGDGVSDDIPATIAGKQPARLADGEFVIPARIVSELGNGSTDAGAKRLYAMMDRIQAGRKKTIGKKNVAKDTKAKKHLLA
jgi:hypothetical protein